MELPLFAFFATAWKPLIKSECLSIIGPRYNDFLTFKGSLNSQVAIGTKV